MIVDLCDKIIVVLQDIMIDLDNKRNKTDQEKYYREELAELHYKITEAKMEFESKRFFPYFCETCNTGTFI